MIDPTLDRTHPAFKETAFAFFDIVMQGLGKRVKGEHFWDAVADDVVFEFSYRFEGLPPRLEGRDAYMQWFAHYPNILKDSKIFGVYEDKAKDVVILDYEVSGVSATGKEYRNRFCSIVTVKNHKIVHWIDFADTLSAMNAMSA